MPGQGLLNKDGSTSAISSSATPTEASARATTSSAVREEMLSQMEKREGKDTKSGPFIPGHLAAVELAEAGATLADRDSVKDISRLLEIASAALDAKEFDKTKADKAVQDFLKKARSFRSVATAGAKRLANRWLAAKTLGLIQLQAAPPGEGGKVDPDNEQLRDQVNEELRLLAEDAEAEAQSAIPQADAQADTPAPKTAAAAKSAKAGNEMQDAQKAAAEAQKAASDAQKAANDAARAAYDAQIELARKAQADADKASQVYNAAISRRDEANRKAAQLQGWPTPSRNRR